MLGAVQNFTKIVLKKTEFLVKSQLLQGIGFQVTKSALKNICVKKCVKILSQESLSRVKDPQRKKNIEAKNVTIGNFRKQTNRAWK